MILQTLNGDWQFRQAGTGDWLSAQVPGGVHTDLLAAGRIPDPFLGDNEKQVQWVAEQNWEYRRNFAVEPALNVEERIYLVCEGLDTLAEVRLNGFILGQAENMFRRYRWEVKDLLQPGENELAILFSSPVAFARTQNQVRPLPEMGDWLRGGSHLRKAPCHFGWDWGPRLPCIGIWRGISLRGFSLARLEDVHLRQQHTEEGVTLTASVRGETWGKAELGLQVRVTAPDGEVFQAEAAGQSPNQFLSITISHPRLWWPNGYGDQPLYQVEVLLSAGEALLDYQEYQLGLRSVELHQQEDAWGRSFTFVVNGVPVFCKGSNWIPVDAFPTRVTAGQLEHLIRSAVDVHQNMLRVWGGGYYEDETFYNLCDRFGLLVWQDFMFSCAVYPWDDEAWLANVEREVIENVRCLRHHACLALWCGNNEIELLWDFFRLSRAGVAAGLERAYERFFYHLLPQWITGEDPDHAYWPSSPASGAPFQAPNSEPAGDAHHWDVWHMLKPASSYRQKQARFVSEFGFEALPALQTVSGFARLKASGLDRWRSLNTPLVKHHQRGAGGNAKIIYYLTGRFRLPKEFNSLVYLSQVMQAEAVRIGVEHWRRKRERCSGALYWQLNDCWPAISWSSIDYYGHWKALHYVSRRFFAPVLLSLEEEGNRVGMYVTNDGVQTWQGQLSWSLETMQGEALVSGGEMVSAHPLATTRVCIQDMALHLKKHDRTRLVLVCALWQGDKCISSQVLPLVLEKLLRLNRPEITMEVKQEGEQLAVTCRARSLARFVELSLYGAETLFSDNFFDLPPGRPVTVNCPLPNGWTLDRARMALRVRSLVDSGDCYSLLYSNFIHIAAGIQALLQILSVNLAALIKV